MPQRTPYRGRFAPSPTGPLHFGSLIAAVASYLEARSHHGEWLIRMEDVDQPRCVPGADSQILHTLEAFGFEWQGAVLYQTQRDSAYADALQQLENNHLSYRCTCTRSELSAISETSVYPGLCANKNHPAHSAHAIRLRTVTTCIAFNDAVMGSTQQNIQTDVGDFVIRRRDGLFAYQLAVVVDDAFQNITHVVRGADLRDSTPRQIYLQQCLGYATPQYTHLPLAVNAAGEKLSKQTYATQVTVNTASLFQALAFLGQQPPAEFQHVAIAEIWAWAVAHWDLQRVPTANIPVTN